MNIFVQSTTVMVSLLLAFGTVATTVHAQGALTPPGPPGPTMYSLQDIHDDVSELSDGWSIITNALGTMDWNDILQTWMVCQVLTQQIHSATNVFAEEYWPVISNACFDLRVITNALADVDWNDILFLSLQMASLTNDVGAMATLFESINWGAISNLAVAWPVVTNALWNLWEMEWNDVLAIKSQMNIVTQDTDTLVQIFGTVNWDALSRITDDFMIITNAIGQMDWNDILMISAQMVMVTQDVGIVRELFESVSWGSVSNISEDMSILLDALGNMDWNDVIGIRFAVDGLSNRLDGIEVELDEIRALVQENNALLHAITNSL